jgi:hypothetical protein
MQGTVAASPPPRLRLTIDPTESGVCRTIAVPKGKEGLDHARLRPAPRVAPSPGHLEIAPTTAAHPVREDIFGLSIHRSTPPSRCGLRGDGPRRRPRGAHSVTRWAVLVAILACAAVGGASAQVQPDSPYSPPIAGGWEPVSSLGQPPRWKGFGRLGYGIDRSGSDAAGPQGAIGVYTDLFNPVYGALGLGLQAYVGQRGEGFDAGGQLHLESPATFLHVGIDWSARFGRLKPTLGVQFPVARGGWPVRGGQIRVDWQPSRAQSVVLSLTVPIRRPLEGRTRSRAVDVELPRPPGVDRASLPDAATPLGAAVLEVRQSMEWLGGLHSFFWLTDVATLGYQDMVAETREALSDFRSRLDERASILPDRATYGREVEHYHQSLERAFGLALGGPADSAAVRGRTLADEARRFVLEEVLLPYNRTVGQYKQPDRLDGLAARARARFIAWIELEHPVGNAFRSDVVAVLDAWLGELSALRGRMAELKRDTRMHWIPLALALRTNEHEHQEQIDRLIETALGQSFEGGNTVAEIDATSFQTELTRSIRETESYHVLWIHDYRGWNDSGAPDRTAFEQSTEGYLAALLAAVQRYDATGRLPVFIVMVDQYFYEGNYGRLWFDLLEDPLRHRTALRIPDMQLRVQGLQDSLRAAVAGSRRLQADAEAFGQRWINQVVKVHVNITNPSDFTFRSRRLLRRGPPIGADNLMRDHRKIVIRDVAEDAPERGEVILAGVGVGELYASPTWDDRAMIIRGPAAVRAKTAAREVLERHGLTGRALPAPLRPAPRRADHAEVVATLERAGATARVMQAHNRTGWGSKDATFLQMLLYDLAPAGTVIYVPDSLWTSYEWMAQLVSAALRGCRVYVVAPTLENAPSAGFPVMVATQDLMARLTIVADVFGDVIEEAGGELRVGLYSRKAPLDDLSGLLVDVDTTFAANSFLRDLYPLSEEAGSVLRRLQDRGLGEQGSTSSGADASERVPKLHRKTQLIVSGAVLSALSRSPALPEFLESSLADTPSGPGWQSDLLRSEFERMTSEGSLGSPVLYYLSGSINKNVRSMALDGEVMAAVAGPWALQGYLDFLLLSGGVSWVRSPDEVAALIPPFSGWRRPTTRWLYRVL